MIKSKRHYRERMIGLKSSKNMILMLIVACQLMIMLDSSVMITALPEIGATMHLSTTSLTWVQNAYILVSGGLLLLGARTGDIIGKRRTLSLGIAVFTVASVLVGVAQSTEFLLISRALQGLAAAFATPSTLSLLSVSFTEAKERAKALAVYSAIAGAGGSVGLVLGGWLTEFVSWRVGMFINVPIGIAVLILAPRFLNETDKNAGKFDAMGALTSVLGMSALVFGFIQAASEGWDRPLTLISLAVGAAMLTSFVFIEARAKQPITPLRLFSNRRRSGAYLGRFLMVAGNYSLFFFLPQYLQNVLGFTAFQAGIAFLPMMLVQFGMMYAMPRLISRFGNLKVLIAGIAIAIIGTLLLSRLSSQTLYFPEMFFPLIIIGIGAGMVFSPFTSFGISEVEARDAGAASGLVNAAHQTGGSLGLAILVTVFEAAMGGGEASKSAFAHATSTAILGSAAFLTAALVVVLVWFMSDLKPDKKASLQPEGKFAKPS